MDFPLTWMSDGLGSLTFGADPEKGTDHGIFSLFLHIFIHFALLCTILQ